MLDEGDYVEIAGQSYHVDKITCDLILRKEVPSTSRVGTVVLIVLLALTGPVLVVRSRRRTVQTAS